MPVFHGHDHSVNQGFGIISINMENRSFYDLANIRTISAGTGVQIIRGKSYLVVDHDMDGSACFITG